MAFLEQLAELCEELAHTSSRIQIVERVAEFLETLTPREAEIVARFLAGRAIKQGEDTPLKLSARSVWRVALEVANETDVDESIFAETTDFGEAVETLLRWRRADVSSTLTIEELHKKFEQIAAAEGPGSRQRKLELLRDLMAQLSPREAKLVAKIVIGEMRHGLGEGLLLEAIAKLSRQPIEVVQRAFMLVGEIGTLAAKAREGTLADTTASSTTVRFFSPLRPMLAQSAPTVSEALRQLDRPAAIEHKLDGARVQIHCANNQVKIFSRRLNEVTSSLPDVTELVRARLEGQEVILDGEVIALDKTGKPLPFQDLMRRFRRTHDIKELCEELPVALFLFDLLAYEGKLIVNLPYQMRWEMLAELAVPRGLQLVGRLVPSSVADAETFFREAIEAGYEGVMVKALDSPYLPGTRGSGWFKIKRAQTLDLVIVAADWGYGRRRGWLSNYHLAVRAESSSNEFLEVGKTFKGPSDEEFEELTQRLLSLKTEQHGKTVLVRPEIVVEVAYSDVQKSPRYPSGFALRFARILRVRDDKTPDQADTLDTVAKRYEQQLSKTLSTETLISSE